MQRVSSISVSLQWMALLGWIALFSSAAHAQPVCSSDGRMAPVALVERFVSADCDACWRAAPTDAPRRGDLMIDWVVPSAHGDEAPLSAAASRDAFERLATQGLALPVTTDSHRLPVRRLHLGAVTRQPMRVAHGPPFNGYLGTSLMLDWPRRSHAHALPEAWLLLVETLPAGSGGSPVTRNLVRHVVHHPWSIADIITERGRRRLLEARSLSIPAGARPERLSLIGFAQNAGGHIVAAAQSHCTTEP